MKRRGLDRRFGGVRIVWDRLCGGFAPLAEPMRQGNGRSRGSNDPIYGALHSWLDLVRTRLGT